MISPTKIIKVRKKLHNLLCKMEWEIFMDHGAHGPLILSGYCGAIHLFGLLRWAYIG